MSEEKDLKKEERENKDWIKACLLAAEIEEKIEMDQEESLLGE